ncbi:cell division protein FtsY [Aggregatibacter aphrophilus]|uniref:Signal recognition particle receptor FtsY n=1 Tax=Aggregatibacter aphrophilus TaxID=732 RepID=A0ABX9VUS2_AGGAP|nr:signal recognition particle-docking protein FtsY [Aggregatibacter aphrophilus]AKU64261.1 cell division protein FtsY [Aggregatibacter aphrophilus]RMW81387.1 signal recognition particle-docking protein FtsY [Aggregatibacter aphrophilus]
MSDEKKKGGFWSWFGLGKNKQEESTEPKEPESTEQLPNESEVQETAEKTTALSDEAETENTLTEDTSMAQASTLVPESHEVQVETSQEENPAAQAWTLAPSSELAPSDEPTQSIEETLENSTALSESEVEVQVESAVDIEDESVAEAEEHEESAVADMVETQEKPSEGGFFSRLLKGLVKTKQNIGAGFRSFFLGKKIDDELFEELEEQLLIADIGMPTTTKIINNLTQHATRQQLQNADALYQQLKLEMGEILKPVAQPLSIDSSKKPYVILMVGVNGVGKTTTIGKLARKFQMEGKSVMLAAGDTFRAAAVEQLQVWGERNHIPVVAQSSGSDSASVIFDAMQSAAARNIDILIADTAGRLQNKNNLMDELKKIVRVMKKYDESAPHEIMLTLDAGTGQNAISQAKLFNEAVGLTGISLTKLDGTAKGGVIFAIADQFNLPIRYIGVGEKIEDLREFNAEEFIEALFAHEEE